jgi:hypothetical protein
MGNPAFSIVALDLAPTLLGAGGMTVMAMLQASLVIVAM